MLHFSKKSVLCQEFLDKYGHRWHKEIVAKQLLIRETHRRTLMLALVKKCNGLIMNPYISLKRLCALRLQAEHTRIQGPRTTEFWFAAPRFLSGLQFSVKLSVLSQFCTLFLGRAQAREGRKQGRPQATFQDTAGTHPKGDRP